MSKKMATMTDTEAFTNSVLFLHLPTCDNTPANTKLLPDMYTYRILGAEPTAPKRTFQHNLNFLYAHAVRL